MPSANTQLWLDKAAEDEQVVALITANGRPWSMAAYHTQQAGEKYIKALLVEKGIAAPKTHDLQGLLALSPLAAPPNVETAADMLSAYAWRTRYPGAPTVSDADAKDARVDLDTIKTWVLSVL